MSWSRVHTNEHVCTGRGWMEINLNLNGAIVMHTNSLPLQVNKWSWRHTAIHIASSSLHRACLVLCQTHLIFVVDVDTEPKRSGAESLIGNETILKGCLAFGLNHTVEGHWSELQQPYTKKLNMMHRDLMPKLLFKNIHQCYRMGRAPT